MNVKEFYEKNKAAYGDIPLKEVAEDVYASSGSAQPYDQWLSSTGTQGLIEEDDYNRTIQKAKAKDIGLVREFGRGIGRGVMQGLPEQTGQALQFVERGLTDPGEEQTYVGKIGAGLEAFGKSMKKEMPTWEPSKKAEVAGSWQRAASSAGESIPSSVAPMVAGTIATGSPIGGLALSGAAKLGLFYAATTEKALREGKAAGLSDAENAYQANMKGASEYLSEEVSDVVAAVTLGALGTPAKEAVKAGAGGIIKSIVSGKSIGQIAKDFFVTGSFEVGSEVANTAVQAGVDKAYGLSKDQDPVADMVDSAKSALVMTLVFNAIGIPYGMKHAANTRKALLDPETPTKQVYAAVNETAHAINEVDPELAKQFTEQAIQLHAAGKPIIFDDDSYYKQGVAREDAAQEAKAKTILSLAKDDKDLTPEAVQAAGLTEADIPHIMNTRAQYEKALGPKKAEIEAMPSEAMKKGALSTFEKQVDETVLETVRPVIAKQAGAAKDATHWEKEAQVIGQQLSPLGRELDDFDTQMDAGRPINTERYKAITKQHEDLTAQLANAVARRDSAKAIQAALAPSVTVGEAQKPTARKIDVAGDMTAEAILGDVEALRVGGDAKTFAQKYGNRAYAYANTHRTQQDFTLPTFLGLVAATKAPDGTTDIQPKPGITIAEHEQNLKKLKLIDDKSKPAEIQALAKDLGIETVRRQITTKAGKIVQVPFRVNELREKIATQMEVNALHAVPGTAAAPTAPAAPKTEDLRAPLLPLAKKYGVDPTGLDEAGIVNVLKAKGIRTQEIKGAYKAAKAAPVKPAAKTDTKVSPLQDAVTELAVLKGIDITGLSIEAAAKAVGVNASTYTAKEKKKENSKAYMAKVDAALSTNVSGDLTPDEMEDFIAQEEAKKVAPTASATPTVTKWSSTAELRDVAEKLGIDHKGLAHDDIFKAIKTAEIDAAANTAATSPQNDLSEPTPAQIEAGNYKKGPVKFQGLDISIENPRGSERKGVSKAGKKWSITLEDHYGYIKGTIGKDKDHIDTFIGENPAATYVYIINQVEPTTKKFDEHKVMLGYDSKEDAEIAYHENYERGWKGMGTIVPMPMAQFKKWLKSDMTTVPVLEATSAKIKTAKEKKPNAKGKETEALLKAKQDESKAAGDAIVAGQKEVADMSVLEEDSKKIERLAKLFDVPMKDGKGKPYRTTYVVSELKTRAKNYAAHQLAKAQDELRAAKAAKAKAELKAGEEKVPSLPKNDKAEKAEVVPASPRAKQIRDAAKLTSNPRTGKLLNPTQVDAITRIANGDDITLLRPKVSASTLKTLKDQGHISQDVDGKWYLSGRLADIPMADYADAAALYIGPRGVDMLRSSSARKAYDKVYEDFFAAHPDRTMRDLTDEEYTDLSDKAAIAEILATEVELHPDLWRETESGMRYEINDQNAEFSSLLDDMAKSSSGATMTMRLDDLVAYGELFDAYPSLSNIKVEFTNKYAAPKSNHYDSTYPSPTIRIQHSTAQNQFEQLVVDTLFHEIQHAIQHAEGQLYNRDKNTWYGEEADKGSYGLSPKDTAKLKELQAKKSKSGAEWKTFLQLKQTEERAYWNRRVEREARNAAFRIPLTAEERKLLPRVDTVLSKGSADAKIIGTDNQVYGEIDRYRYYGNVPILRNINSKAAASPRLFQHLVALAGEYAQKIYFVAENAAQVKLAKDLGFVRSRRQLPGLQPNNSVWYMGKNVPMAAYANAETTTGLTKGEVARGVMKALGLSKVPKWLQIFNSNSDISFAQRAALGHQPIRGAFVDGKIVLVADQITDPVVAIRGVLVHEGGHLLIRSDPVWNKQWKSAYDALTDESKLSGADKALLAKIRQDVANNYVKVWEAQKYSATKRAAMFEEEVMMKYLQKVSESDQTAQYSLWTRIWKAFTSLLFRHFSVSPKTLGLTAQDLVKILTTDLRKIKEVPVVRLNPDTAYADVIKASSRLETEYVAKAGPQGKLPTAEQWVASVDKWLKGSMPGAVKEEVYWSNLREWLERKKGENVTQAEVLDYLKENGLKSQIDVKVATDAIPRDKNAAVPTTPWMFKEDDPEDSVRRLKQAHKDGMLLRGTSAYTAAQALAYYSNGTLTRWLERDAESIYPAFTKLFDIIQMRDYLDLPERDILHDRLRVLLNGGQFNQTTFSTDFKTALKDFTQPGIVKFMAEFETNKTLRMDIINSARVYNEFVHYANAVQDYVNETPTGKERSNIAWHGYSIMPVSKAEEAFTVELSIPNYALAGGSYVDSHFPATPNGIAWGRCIVLPTGEVFINEIQSGIHNLGGSRGYMRSPADLGNSLVQKKYASELAQYNEQIKDAKTVLHLAHIAIKHRIAQTHGKQDAKTNAKVKAYINSYMNSMRFKNPTTSATEPMRKLGELIPGIDIDAIKSELQARKVAIVKAVAHIRGVYKPRVPYFRYSPQLPFKDNYTPVMFKEIIKEAVKRGINHIVWPASPVQVAKIENWGPVVYDEGHWLAHGMSVGGSVKQLTEALTNAVKKSITAYGGILGTTQVPGLYKLPKIAQSDFNMPDISEVPGGFVIQYTSEAAWNHAETGARNAWEDDGNDPDDFELDDVNIDPDKTVPHIFKTEEAAEKALAQLDTSGIADFMSTYNYFIIGDKLRDMALRGEIPMADYVETEPHPLSTEKGKSYTISNGQSELEFEEVQQGIAIHDVFVPKEDRRQGKATAMINEVLNAYNQPVYVGSTSKEMNAVLQKMGFTLLSSKGEYTENANIPEASNSKTMDTWVRYPDIMADYVDTLGRKIPETQEEAEYAHRLDTLASADEIARRAKDINTKQLAQLDAQIRNTVYSEQARKEFGKKSPSGINEYTRTKDTQTTNIFTRMFSLPEYYMRRDSAAEKVLEWAQKQSEIKHVWETNILGETFIKTLETAKNAEPRAYKKATDYLLETDKTGLGYSLRLVKDIWHVISPIGHSILEFKNEAMAVDAMVAEEQKALKARGYSPTSLAVVKEVRELTSRGFNIIAEDMRRQVRLAHENGLPEATTKHIGADGKEHSIKLSEAISLMGDLRGTYFPRERPKKNFVLTAQKENALGKKILIPIDLFMPANELDNALKTGIKNFINSKLPVAEEIKKLKAMGFKDKEISINPVKAATETIYDTPGLLTATDSLIAAALDNIDQTDMTEAEVKLLQSINAKINQNIGDIYKAKGSFSSRLKRSESHWEGYEEDPLKALTSYAQRLSAGVARRTTARGMLEAFTGRDVSFAEYQKIHPAAKYKDYRSEVKRKAVSAVNQKNLYDDVRLYMNHVLRPDNQVERFVGYLKGLTVLKFLGFRVSSAAVNATNMAFALPATIAAHSGLSVTKAWGEITSAAAKYAKYRASILEGTGVISKGFKDHLGKLPLDVADMDIFKQIAGLGWDQAQFNQDTVRVLQNTANETWNKTMHHAMFMFGAVEKANRAISIFAATKAFMYAAEKAGKSISVTEALHKAHHVSNRAHGEYGKGAKPWAVQKVRLLDMPYTFFKFQQNYMLNMLELGMKYNRWGTAVPYMLMSPAVLAGAGASLVTQIIAAAVKALGGGDDPEEAFYSWAEESFGSDAFARHGFAGLLGVNLKGSLEITNPMPDLSKGWLGAMGAPGGIFLDIKDSIDAFADGQIEKGLEKLLPTAAGSIVKGYREMEEGVTDKNYAPTFYGTDKLKGAPMDFALRLMAFNPERISGIRQKVWREDQVRKEYQIMRTNITEGFNHLLINPDNASNKDFAGLYAEIQDYNTAVAAADPKYGVPYITTKWLVSSLKRSQSPSKVERNR